jgi:two-component system, NarL family, response regulator NreC
VCCRKILIADDHGLLRAGLKALLNGESEFRVIGEATDCQEALRLSERLKPDIVLMDLSMPGAGGIETTRILVKLMPSVRVLVLTMHEDAALVREVLQIGAAGYIVKRALESELISALHAVARGEIYVHPAMTRALLNDFVPPKGNNGENERLTPRELDVLRLIVQGHTNRQMADALHLSVRTVESHRANLMAKLGLSSRVELVRYASCHGLLDLAS